MFKVGLDIGSTTIKTIVLDEENNIIYKSYQRHFSHIKEKMVENLTYLLENNIINNEVILSISGSAGMGFAEKYNVEFTQEVYATKIAVNYYYDNIDCVIELGGEDAKILFLNNGLEVRMNGSCAGGTGAFIDQMATLLNVNIEEMNEIAKNYEKRYPIASRCGVFAKSDIQPLLNQGARKEDIAASIFLAVVNQTIGGLAQGRVIKGNVIYLGGPLTFFEMLRRTFDEVLNVKGISPENSLYFVAIGTALNAKNMINVSELIHNILTMKSEVTYLYNEPLFKNDEEYNEFIKRHEKAHVDILSLENYNGKLYLGIDSGSTTLKIVLIDEEENIRYSLYKPNKGNPIKIIHTALLDLYNKYDSLNICGAVSTGYGEELVKNAFCLDDGIVETIAHFIAAKKFKNDVDFVIDIGGQDIKCFKIENQVITNIFLNEACSSGCGSFLQTFANALNYDIKEFALLGLKAQKPVDLGSRCTVFMNSSVKQAQKDGATIENISAGLSLSVVKNALYKVIRTTNKNDLGKNIVVQGGTFLNKSVLRAFEKELGLNVTCPNIAGLMGAYGCALHAKKLGLTKSSLIDKEALINFEHKIINTKCQGCQNHCSLTINTFKNNPNRFISGNKCEKPLNRKDTVVGDNIYEYIRNKLLSYKCEKQTRGDIAIPLVLNMYELYPFWFTFFKELGFNVVTSGLSKDETYTYGQHTIPSDTVCFPAKLVHGHIEKLIKEKNKIIFYPCMSYNIDEHLGDNHFNCPIVAYYPQTIRNNVSDIKKITFIDDFISIDNKKVFEEKIAIILAKYFKGIKKHEIQKASTLAYEEYRHHVEDIRNTANSYLKKAKKNKQQIVILSGRPYHIDPIVNHGIDKLIAEFGVCVLSEECVSNLVGKVDVNVLNQWTFHSRLYAAANYCVEHDDTNLVQLVSFGCGLDAITSDECKAILEKNNKIYTQIKIDEISNLGTVKIRLRSLFSALKQMKG